MNQIQMSTGKRMDIQVLDRNMAFFNQRCRAWSHPYEWEHNGSTLSNAGCGIFSLCITVDGR